MKGFVISAKPVKEITRDGNASAMKSSRSLRQQARKFICYANGGAHANLRTSRGPTPSIARTQREK